MELTHLLAAIIILLNFAASAVVYRASMFSTRQVLLQLTLIWLAPIFGAVVCTALASSQAREPAPPSTVDPLHLPADGGAQGDWGIGVFGCDGVSGSGDGGCGD
jgi:hypothetical protein